VSIPPVPPCRTAPELFFARDNERTDSPEAQDRIADAKAICATCPGWKACRAEGRELQAVGIWGGETEAERTKAGHKVIKRRRQQAACGTEAGEKRHRRLGETPCLPCREGAAAAWQRRKADAQSRLATAA